MHGIDEAVFRFCNRWPEELDPLFWFLSEGSKQTWVRIGLALLALGLCLAGKTCRRAAIQALVAFPLANGITDVLKHSFPVLRPCVELTDVILRVARLDSYGTASAHSANMAAVAFVLTYHLKWWGSIWILVALLTGLSRIYVGVHYPSQVLLGWVCGAFAGLVVVKTWEAVVRLWQGRVRATQGADSPQ